MNVLARKRILVVDDDYLLALDLETFLRDEGCVVVGPVATVESALVAIADKAPDFAILDLDLDGTSSTRIADRLAARGIGFLFISGHSADMLPPAHAQRRFLQKPWNDDELREVLERMLG